MRSSSNMAMPGSSGMGLQSFAPNNSGKGMMVGTNYSLHNHNNSTTITNHNSGQVSSSSLSGGMQQRDSSNSGGHGYCLKWKYHPNNLLHMFNQLLLNETFTDVVVACEGKIIKCHKMVLSACSKYFEQVFCEYPQQNSTLVILKDMKFADVQAIIEFMYQGEINVAHDQLSSLLKAAESLQVKGLADITGGSNGGKNDSNEYGNDSCDEDLPPSPPNVCYDAGSDGGGSMKEAPPKRKRGRPSSSAHTQKESSMDGTNMQQNNTANDTGAIGVGAGFDEFSFGSLLEPHFMGRTTLNLKKPKRKIVLPGGGTVQSDEQDDPEDSMDGEPLEDDDVTADDIANIVKMTDYIERGGSRPQFWDEPTTKKIMHAIRSKKMEMKQAAEILGVSYSTLYSRYRELHGYLKMPHTQDTNFNYYQVLNLLRAGQITLPDAAKRLSIQEKTLGAYLSTTIVPKKPKSGTPSANSDTDAQPFPLALLGNNPDMVLNLKQENRQGDFDDEDMDSDGGGDIPSSNRIKLPAGLDRDIDGDDWSR